MKEVYKRMNTAEMEAVRKAKLQAVNGYLQNMGIRELSLVAAFCRGLLGGREGEKA